MVESKRRLGPVARMVFLSSRVTTVTVSEERYRCLIKSTELHEFKIVKLESKIGLSFSEITIQVRMSTLINHYQILEISY